MRASEEFYRAAANTPQFTQSPYALYHQALDRSTDRRQRLLEQQGAIAARNSEEAWKNINSIPSNAVKGYQAGLDIKGEKQRQDALARQQLIAEEQNARAREAHDLSMGADKLRLNRLQAEHDYEMSPTEEGQARWISEREQKRALDRRAAEMGIKSQEAGIKGQEAAIAFNQFQMAQAQREEQARKIAAIKDRAQGLFNTAALMPDGPEKNQMIAQARALLQQASLSEADMAKGLADAQRTADIENAQLAATQATTSRMNPGVVRTENKITELRNKAEALKQLSDAAKEYKAAKAGMFGFGIGTSMSEEAALKKAIEALSVIDPIKAKQLSQYGRVGSEGQRQTFLQEIADSELKELESQAQMVANSGDAPLTGSLDQYYQNLLNDIAFIKGNGTVDRPAMGLPGGAPMPGGQNSGMIPAGAGPGGIRSMRNRMTTPPAGSGVAKPPQVYNHQNLMDNMWGPT